MKETFPRSVTIGASERPIIPIRREKCSDARRNTVTPGLMVGRFKSAMIAGAYQVASDRNVGFRNFGYALSGHGIQAAISATDHR
jgi:hypothetical protein